MSIAVQTQGGNNTKQRIDPLTTWRFFAAALVVFHHCSHEAFQTAPAWFRCLIQNGYQAVSFFFVLSGFVLAYTYHQAGTSSGLKGSPSRFWIARFARIYPTYALALAIAFPALLYYLLFKGSVSPSSFTLTLLATPLLLQAWLNPGAQSWNGPAWSLSVEAFFYLCFPRLARCLATKTPRFWLCSSLVLVLSLNLARHCAFPLRESGALGAPSSYLHHVFAYFPLVHLPTFLFGMALGKVYLSLPGARTLRYSNSALLGAIAALLLLFSLHGKVAPVLLSDTVMVPLFGLIVFTSATCSGALDRALSHPWLVELGEASYAMYILHVPLVWWMTRMKQLTPDFRGKNDVFFGCFFILLTVGCVLTFEYFEKPLRKRISSRLTQRFLTGREAKSPAEGGGLSLARPGAAFLSLRK